MRWIPFLMVLLGCAKPALHPTEIGVREIEYGVYAHVDGEDVLVERTNEVPCRPDAKFGSSVRLTFPNDDGARLPIRVQILEPEIPGIRPPYEIKPDDDFLMPKGVTSFVLTILDEFKGEFDLVDGQYEVRLIEPETRLSYYSRRFYLRDCEGTSPHNKQPCCQASLFRHGFPLRLISHDCIEDRE